MEWMDKATKAILDLIAHREVLAIVLGVLASFGITQTIKTYIASVQTRLRVNALAIVIGAAVSFSIFPAEHGLAVRSGFALVVGLLSPLAYKAAMWLIAKKWPDAADRLSADL